MLFFLTIHEIILEKKKFVSTKIWCSITVFNIDDNNVEWKHIRQKKKFHS